MADIPVKRFQPVLHVHGLPYDCDVAVRLILIGGGKDRHIDMLNKTGFAGGTVTVLMPPWFEGGNPCFDFDVIVYSGKPRKPVVLIGTVDKMEMNFEYPQPKIPVVETVVEKGKLVSIDDTGMLIETRQDQIARNHAYPSSIGRQIADIESGKVIDR